MSNALKVREIRLRNQAKRQGYQLFKSRARDPRALEYGLYILVDMQPHYYSSRHSRRTVYSKSLDDIESSLNWVRKLKAEMLRGADT